MNRRMRTRMSGGVRGGAGDRSLYSILDDLTLLPLHEKFHIGQR
jgi:hypothetical protein